ncbi:isochorismate synthase [Mesobacillus foraminis]|uniref:Isochorismate synthase MenF n=1 Tax=Mesobacillus foraminis TaxID=279826 RepID=A0A4R2BBN1_9BACI|nr:isochorismate synthase [Mesobacillus foraminis]
MGGINLVTIQDTELRKGIIAAIDRAKELSQSVLVSEIQRIEYFKAFNFFAAGRSRFLGERFYWEDPDGTMALAGLGVTRQIHADSAPDRFNHTESEWKRFIETAIIVGDQTATGTGPAMFGGFSFDPLKEKTGLWSKFSDSLFHIPKYMLTVKGGQAFLTTNVVCTQHDDDSLFEKVNQERLSVFTSAYDDGRYRSAELKKVEEKNPEKWKETVSRLVASLKDSHLKKVVLAREIRLFFNQEIEIEKVLSHLVVEQRGSFLFAFEANGDCFIGASPERLVKKEGDEVFSTCLAGSIARGGTPEEDRMLGKALLEDQKNLNEHQYVVEMISEAMLETCEKVKIPNSPKLMKMKYIQHLYTPVVGKSRAETSLLHLVDRLHPTPALGGLPKQDAIEKIREIEDLDRGFYAAPIGWMDYKANGEFAVAIRSALVQGKEASLFAGCGVLADSNAESEFNETSIKFRPMLTALGGKEK